VTPGPAEAVTGIQTATPKADGSILHTVEQGQTLWSIATSYKISLNDLYALNRLDDQSVIFPGDRLVIRQAGQTLTPTLPVTGTVSSTTPGTPAVEGSESSAAPASPTPRPATRTTAPTEKPAPTRAAAGLAEEQLTGEPGTEPDEEAALQRTGQGGFDPMLLIIGAFALLGAGLMLVGTLLKRNTPD
jgi:LysM repeat protein